MQVSPDKSGLQDYPSGVAVPAGDDKLTGVTQPGGSATPLRGAEPFVFLPSHGQEQRAAARSRDAGWADDDGLYEPWHGGDRSRPLPRSPGSGPCAVHAAAPPASVTPGSTNSPQRNNSCSVNCLTAGQDRLAPGAAGRDEPDADARQQGGQTLQRDEIDAKFSVMKRAPDCRRPRPSAAARPVGDGDRGAPAPPSGRAAPETRKSITASSVRRA